MAILPALSLFHDGHGIHPRRVLHGGQLHLLESRAGGLSLPLLLLLISLLLLLGGCLGSLVSGGLPRRVGGGGGRGGGEGGGWEGGRDTDCHTL